ncbi:MAG: ATP-binding protein [Planctomycetes bacterium]|nr:ATP-binding protein [Planctomycetota bacterium]
MAFDQRAKRVKLRVRVQLDDEQDKQYYGLTNDISESGFSAFLRCKEDFVIDEVAKNAFVQIHFEKLESLFFDRVFRVVFNLELPLKPVLAEVVRVENSWLKGFEVFVACRFVDLNAESQEILSGFIARHQESLERETILVHEEEAIRGLDLSEGETLKFEFPGRFLYVSILRDLIERLAQEIGFSELDAFKIKVAADEVLTNAFKHGCPEYADNTIVVRVTLDRKGIFVRVRDEGGIKFDYRKFRDFDAKFPESSRTGLHLVDKFTDGWMVDTEEGKYTEVSFFKHRKSSSEGGDPRPAAGKRSEG